MFGFRFIKFDASSYVIQYQNGMVRREGQGLSFWYFSPVTTLVKIPMGSNDAPFIFEEITEDYQKVTIQGQITYQIEDPKQLAAFLDFTVNDVGEYISDDHEKFHTRLINEAQTTIAAEIEKLSLLKAIRSAKQLEELVFEGLMEADSIKMLGVIPLSVSILGIRPTPEMARALETQTRELLQKEADLAIYSRRKFAVEQERKIKETELNTAIAVEEKQKQIAEKKNEKQIAQAENDRKLRIMKVDADIAIEKERQKLIDIETDNQKKLADTEIYRLEKILKEYKSLDWRLLTAMNNQLDPGHQIAMAFRELAENSQKIGTLNISPELLESLARKNKA